MTLWRLLRDYLYFPLGGSRKGYMHSYLNIMITMLLGGMGLDGTLLSGVLCMGYTLHVTIYGSSYVVTPVLHNRVDLSLV